MPPSNPPMLESTSFKAIYIVLHHPHNNQTWSPTSILTLQMRRHPFRVFDSLERAKEFALRSFKGSGNQVEGDDSWILRKELMPTDHHWLNYRQIKSKNKWKVGVPIVEEAPVSTYLEGLGRPAVLGPSTSTAGQRSSNEMRVVEQSDDEHDAFHDAQETVDAN